MRSNSQVLKKPWYFHADERVALTKPVSLKACVGYMAIYILAAIVANYLFLIVSLSPTIAAGASNFGATYLVSLLFCRQFFNHYGRMLRFTEYRSVAMHMVWGMFGAQLLIAAGQVIFRYVLRIHDCTLYATTASCPLVSPALHNALTSVPFYIVMLIIFVVLFLLTMLFVRLTLRSGLKLYARAARLRKDK